MKWLGRPGDGAGMEEKEKGSAGVLQGDSRPGQTRTRDGTRAGESGVRHRNRRMEKRVSGNAQLDRRMPEASPWAQLPANVSVKPTKRSPLTAARIDIADARAVGLGFLLCSIVSKRPG